MAMAKTAMNALSGIATMHCARGFNANGRRPLSAVRHCMIGIIIRYPSQPTQPVNVSIPRNGRVGKDFFVIA